MAISKEQKAAGKKAMMARKMKDKRGMDFSKSDLFEAVGRPDLKRPGGNLRKK